MHFDNCRNRDEAQWHELQAMHLGGLKYLPILKKASNGGGGTSLTLRSPSDRIRKAESGKHVARVYHWGFSLWRLLLYSIYQVVHLF